MNPPDRPVILMGFKHAGKSSVGQAMAAASGWPFADLDDVIQTLHGQETGRPAFPRQIMTERGEEFFRDLENRALRLALQPPAGIIALGGGTAMHAENRRLLARCLRILLTADADAVFERIMAQGRPAFFPPDEDARAAFNRLWRERGEIHREIADMTVGNDTSAAETARHILHAIEAGAAR